MDITKFNEKFNKIDGQIYVMEEVVIPKDGIYESELAHDNVNLTTLNIYTGSKLTGDKINTYTTSTPSLTPWKTVIKIYSTISPLYISYEFSGDIVEAEDINNVQDAIVDTQKALNSEVDRAKNTETTINNDLTLYKTTNNAEIQGLKAKDVDLDNKKSNLDYVNTEFGKRYTKDLVFTKDEVLQKIKDLIGTAPQTLDTFKEIADALGNNPNFATTIMDLLSKKVDKLDGKQLSTNDYSNTEKATVADVNSKKHEHPNKSIIDTITQALIDTWNSAYTHISDTIKHITNTERINWNNAFSHISDTIKHITSAERDLWNTVSNKAETIAVTSLASNLNAVTTTANNAKSSIDGLQIGGRNLLQNTNFETDTCGFSVYDVGSNVGTTVSISSDYSYNGLKSLKFIRASAGAGTAEVGITRECTNVSSLVGKTITFSMRVRGVGASIGKNVYANIYDNITGGGAGASIVLSSQWQTVAKTLSIPINATSVYVYWLNRDLVAGDIVYADCAKLEIGNKPTDWTPAPEDIQAQLDTKADAIHTHDDRYYTETESDNKFATKGEISQAGYGDMLKSVYDTNGDGIVDNADKLDGKHASEFTLTTGETRVGAPNASQYYTSHLASNQLGFCLNGNVLNIPFKTTDGLLKNISIDSGKVLATTDQLPTSLPANGGTSMNIKVQDVRDTDPTPNQLTSNSVASFFDNKWDGSWQSALSIKGWSAGYAAWQLMGGANTSTTDEWYLRSGVNDGWNSRKRIWHDGNLNPNTYVKKGCTWNDLEGV